MEKITFLRTVSSQMAARMSHHRSARLSILFNSRALQKSL
jgi:hypothetical protein